MDTENKKNKQNYLGVIIIIVIVAITAYYLGVSNKQPQLATPNLTNSGQRNQPSPTPNPSSANVYNYTEAPNHIWEYAGVRGTVVRVYTSKKGVIFFDYCPDYRNCPFSAVIFASEAGGFIDPLQYQGQQITITGRIKSYQGKAEIILDTPDQISR